MKTKTLVLQLVPIMLLAYIQVILVSENEPWIAPLENISGTVLDGNGLPVNEVMVSVEGSIDGTTLTNTNGNYSFSNIPIGSNVLITPSKPIDFSTNDSLSIADIIKIRSAILQLTTFETPCQTIAADVNGDTQGAIDPIDGVSTFDQVLIHSVILGNSPGLNPAWEFIPADANQFTGTPVSNSITIDNLPADVTADFLAIRQGDVTSCSPQVYIPPFLTVAVDANDVVSPGAMFEVPVIVIGFAEVAGVQFSVDWDPTVLSFSGIGEMNLPGLAFNHFGTTNTTNGKLGFAWFDQLLEGQSLPDGSVLFTLQFEAIGLPGTSTPIQISNEPTYPEVVNAQMEIASLFGEEGFVSIAGGAVGVSGNISSWQANPVPGVKVNLTGTDMDQQLTDSDGDYAFANLTAGGDYIITPLLNEDCPDCINIQDVAAVVNHILGIQQLENPYQLIAADVNNSQSITGLDLVLMLQMIKGEITSFDNNTCWRFIDATYLFPNPSMPWLEPIPELISITNLSVDSQADFIGIKTGDVIGDCPLSFSSLDTLTSLQLTLGETPCPGDFISVPVTVSNFQSLIGIQTTFAWDPSVLTYTGVTNLGLPGLSSIHFGESLAPGGLLTLAWVSSGSGGVSLPDGAILFEIEFQVTGVAGSSAILYNADVPTMSLVVNTQLEPLALGGDTLAINICSTCEELIIESEALVGEEEDCCYALTYTNDYSEPVYGVGIVAQNGATLVYDPALIPAPLRRFLFNDNAILITEENGNALPTGLVDTFFQFCLANVEQSPAGIQVNWYNEEFDVVCDEIIEYDCAPDTNSCLYIVSDSLVCENNTYDYFIKVKNPINSGFNVGRIKFTITNPPNLTPTTILVDLLPGDTLIPGESIDLSFPIAGDSLAGKQLCFILTAHDGPEELLCCSEEEGCVLLPDCDPCNNVMAEIIPKDTLFPLECCYDMLLSNTYTDVYFTGIQTTILNPGVSYSTIDYTIGSGWAYQDIGGGSNQLLWQYNGGNVPIMMGENLFDFCLDGLTTTDSVQIAVQWMLEDSIACADTLSIFCPECLVIVEDTISCNGNDGYLYNFTLQNYSTYQINAVAVLEPDGQNYLLDSLFMLDSLVAPGQVYSEVSIPISPGIAGDTLCFTYILRQISGDSINIFCCYVEHCIVLPDCPLDLCDCENPPVDLDFVAQGFLGEGVSCINAGGAITVSVDSIPDCYNGRASLRSLSGGIVFEGAGSFPITYSDISDGTYEVCMAFWQVDQMGNLCTMDTAYICDTLLVSCAEDCFSEMSNPNAPCPYQTNLVCGCDDMTYLNPCAAANWGGLEDYELGPCDDFQPTPQIIITSLSLNLDQSVTISWQEFIAEPLRRYIIQRSHMNGPWITLADRSIFGPLIYTDPAPSIGTNYYRVLAVGTTGKVFSCLPQSVLVFDPFLLTPEAWPNPAKNLLHLKYPKAGTYEIKLFGIDGKIYLQKQLIDIAPNTQVELKIANIPPGLYWLRATSLQGDIYIQKIIKTEP